jgi:hypothetical protein
MYIHLNELLGSSELGGKILVLQHLLVGRLEQAVARRRLGENKERHGGK